jgi:hypothetical protein
VVAARHPLSPPTEVESLQVQSRAVQAAQSLSDDLLNQLRRDPTRLERLRRLWRREGAAGVLRRL